MTEERIYALSALRSAIVALVKNTVALNMKTDECAWRFIYICLEFLTRTISGVCLKIHDDVINFKINRSFFIKPLSYVTKNIRTKV